MKYQRKFVIKIINAPWTPWINKNKNLYIKDFIKNSIGFHYTTTHILENAKFWRYKKTCENSINLFLKNMDNLVFEIIEITDNQTLRNIKLNIINRLNKDEN